MTQIRDLESAELPEDRFSLVGEWRAIPDCFCRMCDALLERDERDLCRSCRAINNKRDIRTDNL